MKQLILDGEIYKNKKFQKLFLVYKRDYRKFIRAAKKIYYNAQIKNSKNKSKAKWPVIKEQIGKCNSEKYGEHLH